MLSVVWIGIKGPCVSVPGFLFRDELESGLRLKRDSLCRGFG